MSNTLTRVIPFSPPDITDLEINEVIDTLRSGWITTGPKTKKLECEIANFINTDKVVCLNSATACMEMTLRLLGVGPGDEVIVPAYTYTASCSIIYHVGATPIMVDCAKDSFEMDYEELSKVITNKTKVIIPVDLAGIICDYDQIFKIVEEKKSLFSSKNEIHSKIGRIVVLADAAHAFGATRNGLSCGEIADFTSFSFHAVKNFTTAEGGAVTWNPKLKLNDEYIYKQYQLLSLHGQSKDALSKMKIGSWEYDIVTPAYKCNMTDIQASLGLAQLKRYPDLLKRRYEIVERYNKAFYNTKISFLNHLSDVHLSSCHLYLIRIKGIVEKERNEIIEKLAEYGISVNVHYKPLPLLSAYKKMGFSIENYPNAFEQYQNEITLPLYSTLSNEDVDYICNVLKEVIK